MPGKWIRLALFLIGALVLTVGAQSPPVIGNDVVTVSLSIEQFSEIGGLDPIDVEVERRQTSGSGRDNFTATTNSTVQFWAGVTPPPGAPGVWTIAVSPEVLPPGPNQQATVTITVSGLQPIGKNREWENVQYSVMVVPGG